MSHHHPDPSHNYHRPGRLHPFWSFMLMTLCVNGALIVGAYALVLNLLWLGAIVSGALLLGALAVYLTA